MATLLIFLSLDSGVLILDTMLLYLNSERQPVISGVLSAGFQTSGLLWTPAFSLSTLRAGDCPTRMDATDSRWPRVD